MKKVRTSRAWAIQLSCALIALHARAESSPRAAATENVVATYQTGHITREDVESVIAHRLPAQRARIAAPGGLVDLVDKLIRYDVLVQEARARGYERNLLVRDAAMRQAVDLAVAERVTIDPKNIPAADVQRALEEHRREFTRPYMRRATQLQVATKSEADMAVASLKHATREQFSQYVREHSTDVATRGQGGELGYFDKDGNTDLGPVVPPQLTAAVYKLQKVGEITGPVEQPNGFSVLMWTGEMKAYAMPAAEAEEIVREKLRISGQNAALEVWLNELRAQLKPVMHPELVDSVVLPQNELSGIPEGFPAAPPDPREPPKVVEPDKY